ncbi:hypothetical protein PMAYCL1PPCAC_19652, partial [Pristionchus mayeri]
MQLLKQSLVAFALYAASILCVFVMQLKDFKLFKGFDLAYVENLLNLSIAAVYPICFFSMSGEMKRILIEKIAPRSMLMVASIA